MEKSILTENFILKGKKRSILIYPHPCLDKVCQDIKEFNEEITNLAQDMLTTMYEAPGIGLAASQIGVEKNIFVLDVNYKREEETEKRYDFNPMVFINPVITERSEKISTQQEGCLSLPGVFEDITRAETITVKYQNLQGEPQSLTTDGLLATCIQHETDHLNGKTFLHYLSPFKRNFYKKKLVKDKKKMGK